MCKSSAGRSEERYWDWKNTWSNDDLNFSRYEESYKFTDSRSSMTHKLIKKKKEWYSKVKLLKANKEKYKKPQGKRHIYKREQW